eukprot:14175198-Alexandrium_andersonii.AAC.1
MGMRPHVMHPMMDPPVLCGAAAARPHSSGHVCPERPCRHVLGRGGDLPGGRRRGVEPPACRRRAGGQERRRGPRRHARAVPRA